MIAFDLQGKVALVTGAGQGLGYAIASRLAEAGAWVAVNDIDAQRAQDASERIARAGGTVCAAPGDAAAETAVHATFEAIAERWNGIDILVNNAGIVTRDDIFDIDTDTWDRVLRVNLGGPFLCSREAMLRMRSQGRGGRIVMLGSVVGHQGAIRGWPHYGAAKSGVHGLAKTLARAGAPWGITVNTVAPGVIQTEMLEQGHSGQSLAELKDQIPLGRLGAPEDVAGAVHYLCSDEARYVTGATIDVNGGMYIRA
jgi:3-oxoacyl-[acyl-carrier protein] reductase